MPLSGSWETFPRKTAVRGLYFSKCMRTFRMKWDLRWAAYVCMFEGVQDILRIPENKFFTFGMTHKYLRGKRKNANPGLIVGWVNLLLMFAQWKQEDNILRKIRSNTHAIPLPSTGKVKHWRENQCEKKNTGATTKQNNCFADFVLALLAGFCILELICVHDVTLYLYIPYFGKYRYKVCDTYYTSYVGHRSVYLLWVHIISKSTTNQKVRECNTLSRSHPSY